MLFYSGSRGYLANIIMKYYINCISDIYMHIYMTVTFCFILYKLKLNMNTSINFDHAYSKKLLSSGKKY